MQYLGAISKMIQWFLIVSKANRSTITVIQVYASVTNGEEAEVEQFYEDLQDFLEVISKKDVLFITEDWNVKVGSQASLALEYKMKQGKG